MSRETSRSIIMTMGILSIILSVTAFARSFRSTPKQPESCRNSIVVIENSGGNQYSCPAGSIITIRTSGVSTTAIFPCILIIDGGLNNGRSK